MLHPRAEENMKVLLAKIWFDQHADASLLPSPTMVIPSSLVQTQNSSLLLCSCLGYADFHRNFGTERHHKNGANR